MVSLRSCNIWHSWQIFLDFSTGPSPPAVPTAPSASVTSPTSALIQWSIRVVPYTPEQYTVYYTTNSCPTNSDDGYDKSSIVYGFNHSDFLAIRDQQYNATLDNLRADTEYCFKVVATSTEGRSESVTSQFVTTETGMFIWIQSLLCCNIMLFSS